LQALAQSLALRGRDFLRHTQMLILRQKHQLAAGDADLRRQARALGADRVFEHLHQQRLALEQLALDGQGAAGLGGRCGLLCGLWCA